MFSLEQVVEENIQLQKKVKELESELHWNKVEHFEELEKLKSQKRDLELKWGEKYLIMKGLLETVHDENMRLKSERNELEERLWELECEHE